MRISIVVTSRSVICLSRLYGRGGDVPYLPERSPHFFAPDSQLKIRGAAVFPGDFHQSPTIPPWPMCVTIQGPSIPSEVESLQRVSHEGKPCLKGEQRHPPCLSKVPLS